MFHVQKHTWHVYTHNVYDSVENATVCLDKLECLLVREHGRKFAVHMHSSSNRSNVVIILGACTHKPCRWPCWPWTTILLNSIVMGLLSAALWAAGALLLWGGWIGVCKSADPCYFLAKSVNPPIFSFKSESALFESFEWYSFIATDGRCCFICQFLKRFRFIACFCNSSAKRPKKTQEDRPMWSEFSSVSTTHTFRHEESGIRAKIISKSAIRCIRNPRIRSMYRKNCASGFPKH